MMGARSLAPMSRPAAGRLAGALVLMLPLGLAQPGLSAPAAAAYPPAETFRRIQLSTFACGRENTAESCDKARGLADPLLDHPRLPSSCKDALWDVSQLARTAPQNSFARRDPIDEAANRVRLLCRQPVQPASAGKNGSGSGGAAGSGGSSEAGGGGGNAGFRFGSP